MWHKIFFNAQNIKRESPGSTLIKMPNNSKFLGYYFWHPKKLVREQGGKGYHLSFSFTKEFTFRLKKYGQGRYNQMDVINEIELSAEQMMEAWGVVNESVHDFVEQETDSINEKIAKMEEVVTIVTTHVPEHKEPIESNSILELKKWSP